jgi:isoleucyl-tRNA synthetase
LWNSWYFLSLYANAAGTTGRVDASSTDVLDRYVLAKTHELVRDTTAAFERNDLFDASARVRTFLDALTNWYIRRSRDRFWAGDQAAINTLHTVLDVVCRVAAPLLPLTTEAIHRGLTGERSVHLRDWPTVAEVGADDDLVAAMDLVRDACSAVLSVRKAHSRRVRLPLSRVVVAAPNADILRPFERIIADEVNIREVVLSNDLDAHARRELVVTPAVLGPRLGSSTQKVIAAVKSGAWTRDADGNVVAGGITLNEGEYALRLVATADASSAAATLADGSGIVVVDITVTPELQREGTARDLIRLVQQARRDAGLHVSDRIIVSIGVPAEVHEVVTEHRAMIAAETLAHDIVFVTGRPTNTTLDEEAVFVGVERLP